LNRNALPLRDLAFIIDENTIKDCIFQLLPGNEIIAAREQVIVIFS
jgi:hypothetical protein